MMLSDKFAPMPDSNATWEQSQAGNAVGSKNCVLPAGAWLRNITAIP